MKVHLEKERIFEIILQAKKGDVTYEKNSLRLKTSEEVFNTKIMNCQKLNIPLRDNKVR